MKFFEASHNLLDDLGYESLNDFQSNITIKGVDFAKAKADKKIEYREDGVYLFKDGHWIRGFYYMATYDIDRYDKYPRFHLFNCEVMANKALYRGKYIWANDKTVNVRNRQTKKLLEDVELKLCSKCARLLTGEINSTQEFYESNEHAKEIEVVEELNIYGYPKNWREIATDFKKRNGLTCKICNHNDHQQINKWFYDVDHINGNKMECKDHNLQVICKLCHTYKDEYHLNQALKFPNRNKILHEFVKRNKEALINNEYLHKYLVDFSKYLY